MKNKKNTDILGNFLNFWHWLKTDRKRLGGVIAIVALLIIGIWRQVSVTKNKVSYQTTAVTRGTIISSVSASGQILTSNLTNIETQATGLVKTVYVTNGQKVYAGQKIAEIMLDSAGALKNAQAWASLVSAQNAVNAANNNYRLTQASLQKVYDDLKGHDADETFTQKETRTRAEVANDNAYDQLRSARASLAAASLSYRESSPAIIAPAAGTVDNVTLVPGMVLSSSSSGTTTTTSFNRIAVVTSAGSPVATFNVSEVDINRVKPDQKATVTIDSISEKTFTGKVLTVDKIGVVSSGITNYPVIIVFDSGAPEILPNMAATAKIIIDLKNDVLKVPSAAVQVGPDGGPFVRVLRGGEPQNVTVETGLSSDTETEIVSGVNEGDEVITATSSGATSRVTSTSPFSTFRVGGAVRIAR